MNDEEKIARALELLEELSELYPDIDKMIMDDTENPNYIILSTTEFLNRMAESFDGDFEEVAASYPNIKPDKKKYRQ
jgi:hypothetical protein